MVQMQNRKTKTEIEIPDVFFHAFTFFSLSDVLLCVVVAFLVYLFSTAPLPSIPTQYRFGFNLS